MRSTHTPSQVLPSTWSSESWSSENILRGEVRLLSLDIFGFALSPAVLDPADLHRLVQTRLNQAVPYDVPDYVQRRYRAESMARRDAANQGRHGIGLADVFERLGPLLANDTDQGEWLARCAVKTEIDYQQQLHRPNPDALTLYRDAMRAGIPVAFVADSLLPRDVVTKMLLDSGYERRCVEVVSSHDGVTKASGGLYRALTDRTGVLPANIVHVGPDPKDDVVLAREAGLRPIQVRPARVDVREMFELNLTERTGLDSIALALACDRMGEVENQITPHDIGYYATGPLLCGFSEWVVRQIDDLDPGHVLFCGPAGRLLRELSVTLRPDLDSSRLLELESACGEPPPLADVEQMVASNGLIDRQTVLTVDLGWAGTPHRWLPAVLAEIGRSVEVTSAYLAVPASTRTGLPIHGAGVRTWAFGRGGDSRIERMASNQFDVWRSLVPSSDHTLDRHGEEYRDALPQIRAGAISFAGDFRRWMDLGEHRCTPALAEPALRIIASPTVGEAGLLGQFHTKNPSGSGTAPLAVLPELDAVARNPMLIAAASQNSAWPEGYHVLSEGEAVTTSIARRRNRGLRRGLLSRDQPS